MIILIGQKIKDRREYLNLSQRELAEGLCTQALISKIEQGKIKPSSKIIQQLSNRLQVPTSYFFRENSNHKSSDIQTFEENQNLLNYKNSCEI